MKNLLIFLFSISTFHFSYSQNNGFLGKKNFIAADVRLYSPMIHTIFTGKYADFKTSGSNFQQKGNPIEYGFNFSIGRAMNRNVGFILQYARSSYHFNTSFKDPYFTISTPYNDPQFPDYIYYNYESYYIRKSNWFSAKSTTIMPIIELTNSQGLLPIGLSHQFGIGFNKNYFVEKDYSLQLYSFTTAEYFDQSIQNLYNYKQEAIKSYAFMYKINLRIPINKFLLYNLGFRYNLNWFPGLKSSSNLESDLNYIFNQSDVREMMSNKQGKNILSLETGISFCF